MRFGLLGPFSVDDDGPVEIRGGQRRTLLAALLLEPNTAVSADRLVDLLWGTDAAAPAGIPLYNQITRLRQALGDTDRIRAATPGYLIQVDPGELDTLVFAERASAGRQALAEQNWPQAAEQFAAALALWRGNPLEDVPALSGDNRLRELEETRVQVLHGRIEADLHLGRHEALAEELPDLVEAHPRHAAFRGQLMLALYRAGRRKEALAVYDAFRTTLAEELGLEPPAELQTLNSAIEHEDPALALAPEPTAARDQGAKDAPRQLPADVRTFTGRDKEFGDLLDAAEKAAVGGDAGTLVISALDGMGGIGKTALAVRVAHRVAGQFPDGQLFIDLRGHASAEAVEPGAALAYLLRSLGVPPQAVPDDVAQRAALYRSKLAGRRTLILLDNAADAEQVRPLLPDTPSALLLITSRSRLAGLEGARSLTLDTLSVPESVSLLRALAGPERNLAESAALLELAELCGHIPLALRIVAARLRHHHDLTVGDLAAELRDEGARLDRLTDGERDLTSVFDSSFANLPEPEQNLLRLLGLVPGSDVDAYAAANLLGADLETAQRLLESLVDRNLLLQPAPGRFGPHDLIRAYARTLSDASGGQTREARDRLLDYYQRTAWLAHRRQNVALRPGQQEPAPTSLPTPEFQSPPDAAAWLRTEAANILAAIADQATTAHRRIDLTAAIGNVLMNEGPWSQAMALHRAAAAEAREHGDQLAEANALTDLSRVAMLSSLGGPGPTKELLEQALALFRAIGNRDGQANALARIGQALYFMGETEASLAPSREALDIFRELGHLAGQGGALTNLAQCLELLGRLDEAMQSFREAVRIGEELGNSHVVALLSLGSLEVTIGDLDEAERTLGRALAAAREIGHRHAEATTLLDAGRLASARGEHESADELLRASLAMFEDFSFELGVAIVLHRIGQARIAAGDLETAIDHLERSRAIFLAADNMRSEVDARRDLGHAKFLSGQPDGRVLLEESLAIFQSDVDDPLGEAEALICLSEATAERDGPQRALDLCRQAADIGERTGARLIQARALEAAARWNEALGDREEALEHLRRAVSLYRRSGAGELPAAEARLSALDGGDGGVSERPGTEVS